MINTKRGLYLGLLCSFLGIGNTLQAYQITIKNLKTYETKGMINLISPKGKTIFWIGENVSISYFACGPDEDSFGKKKTITISSGLCLMKKIIVHGAFLYPTEYSPEGFATKYKRRHVKATIEPKLGKRRNGNFELKLKNPSASFEKLKLQIIQTD